MLWESTNILFIAFGGEEEFLSRRCTRAFAIESHHIKQCLILEDGGWEQEGILHNNAELTVT